MGRDKEKQVGAVAVDAVIPSGSKDGQNPTSQLALPFSTRPGARTDTPIHGMAMAYVPRGRVESAAALPTIGDLSVRPDASTSAPQLDAFVDEEAPWVDDMPMLTAAPCRRHGNPDEVLRWWEEARRQYGTSEWSIVKIASARFAAMTLLDRDGPEQTKRLIETYHANWQAACAASCGELVGEPAIELLAAFDRALSDALWFGWDLAKTIWHEHVAAAANPDIPWWGPHVTDKTSPRPDAVTDTTAPASALDRPLAVPTRARSDRLRLAALAGRPRSTGNRLRCSASAAGGARVESSPVVDLSAAEDALTNGFAGRGTTDNVETGKQASGR